MTTDFDHEPYLTRLRRELRKLENAPASPIARRNGRRRVLAAMRLLRAAVDREYPAIVDRTGVKRADPATRIKRLKKAGWRQVDAESAGRFAALGVKIRRVAWTTVETSQGAAQYKNGVGWIKGTVHESREEHEWLFAPDWAIAIGDNPTHIRAALKSRKIKNAAVTAGALAAP